MKLTREQIEYAGRLMKIGRLARQPGMDSVAIKLNSGLTYHETRQAAAWAAAFEYAEKGGDLFEDAAELLKRL